MVRSLTRRNREADQITLFGLITLALYENSLRAVKNMNKIVRMPK